MTKISSNKNLTYTLTPNNTLDTLIERGHGSAAILVYHILCRHYNWESRQCWPSLNTIASMSGLHKTCVSKSLNALAKTGMILRTKNKSINNAFDRNIYYLPHLLAFEIGNLELERKSVKNSKALKELHQLQNFVLTSIAEYMGSSSKLLPSSSEQLGSSNERKGSSFKQNRSTSSKPP